MCCTWSVALNMLSRGPNIMQIPQGYQKKCSLCRKSAIFLVRGGILLLRRVGLVPQKSAHFGGAAPS